MYPGRGQGSLDPPENRKNIVYPCNAGPVKNHKVANLAFNVGPSSVVSYKRKYVHEVLVNCLFKLAQEKVWLGELTVPQ